jgi:hypothetical protein
MSSPEKQARRTCGKKIGLAVAAGLPKSDKRPAFGRGAIFYARPPQGTPAGQGHKARQFPDLGKTGFFTTPIDAHFRMK